MLGGYEGFGVGLVFLVTGLLLALLEIRVFFKKSQPRACKIKGLYSFLDLVSRSVGVQGMVRVVGQWRWWQSS